MPDPTPVQIPDDQARAFWIRVDRPPDPNACWPWAGSGQAVLTAALPDPDHPGQTRRRSLTASRYAWILSRRSDPGPSRKVVTTCGNARCCRPKHLAVKPIGIDPTMHDQIRAWAAAGRGSRDIARQIGSYPGAVLVILRNPSE